MIFLTVGTQMPFDRLTSLVDQWALENDIHVKAQIGNTDKKYQGLEHKRFYDPEEFDRVFNEAELVISHAGTGTIIKALLASKPLVVFPRRADLGEHRNDHQIGTVNSLKDKLKLNVARDRQELFGLLNKKHLLRTGNAELEKYASKELLGAIRDFIQ